MAKLMKNILLFGLLFMILTIQTRAQVSTPILGEVVVRTFTEELPDSVLIQFEGEIVDSIKGQPVFLIKFPETISHTSVLEALGNSPLVVVAEPNFTIQIIDLLQISISSPDLNSPPHLLQSSPPDYYGQQTELNLGLQDTYNLSSGAGIVVGVIDNGLDFSHPLFDGFIDSNGYDFIDNDIDPSETPGTVFGHGTFVSGLVRLVAPASTILPIRSFNQDGEGTTFLAAKGIYHAIEYGAKVINMSFGMDSASEVISKACSDAQSAGIFLVAASGNDGLEKFIYPAANPSVIAVSAIDSLEVIADFSNHGSFIDVCAPGVDIYSSLAGDYDWGWWSGTSFSAAIVSGVAALIASRTNNITAADLEWHLWQCSRIELAWGGIAPPDLEYGYGVINAYSALVTVGRGDLNNSGQVDITDLTKYVDFIFRGGSMDVTPYVLADFNCDTSVNLIDLTSIVDLIFRGGSLYEPCY